VSRLQPGVAAPDDDEVVRLAKSRESRHGSVHSVQEFQDSFAPADLFVARFSSRDASRDGKC
jgi:hypothetical protein